MLKQLAIVTSVAACSFAPTKAISLPYLSQGMVALEHTRLIENNQPDLKLSIRSEQYNHLYRQQKAIFSNWSHDIYGITKSIWRKLGIDSEIDDGTESIFREYGVFFLLFGGFFGWIVYMSLSDLKR